MFLNLPEYRDTGITRNGRAVFELTKVLVFHLGLNAKGGICVTVPVGFQTDFASIPWYLRWLFSPDGPWRIPAILHDYLYSLEKCSRFLADALFREAMAQVEVPWKERVPIYYGVRLFGGSHKTKRLAAEDTEEKTK